MCPDIAGLFQQVDVLFTKLRVGMFDVVFIDEL